MKREQGMTLAQARAMAEALVKLLAPAVGRIEIAGSIRRLKPRPNDIEIVAVPCERISRQPALDDLLDPGEVKRINLLDARCDELLGQGILEKRPDNQGRYCWGTGVKRAIFFQGKDYAPLDLFQVVGSAQWGVIYAIRTGPGDFNHLLVTSQCMNGACPLNRKVAGGRVWDLSKCSTDQRVVYAGMAASRFARVAEQGAIPVDMVPTPEEEDFFAALSTPCWSPEQRTVHRLSQFVRQTR